MVKPKQNTKVFGNAATGNKAELAPGAEDTLNPKTLENLKNDASFEESTAEDKVATDVVIRPPDTSIIAGVSTEQLKQALATQTEQRQLIKEFVSKHLVEGTDYGTIKGTSKSGAVFESGKTLWKPGQEKIFSLFNLTAKLSKDETTIGMLGPENAKGIIAFKCDVYRGNQWITEGRGACKLGDGGRDANSTIKIAEKRARMDACLSLGFSEFFNQDLEDAEYRKNVEEQAKRKADEYERANPFGLDVRDRSEAADDMEKAVLMRVLIKRGITTKEAQIAAMQANGIDDPKSLTSGEIRDLINLAKTREFVTSLAKPDIVMEDIGEEPLGLEDIPDFDDKSKDPPKPLGPTPPPLDVTEDLKEHISNMTEELGLNAVGKGWFMRMTGAAAYASWDKLTDDQWRRAYDLLEDIEGSKIIVEDRYIKGFVEDAPEEPETVDFTESKRSSNEGVDPPGHAE